MLGKMENAFAENLTRFMEEDQLTRHQLSIDLDIPYSTISEWLQGKKYPRTQAIEKIANYLGVTINDLILVQKDMPSLKPIKEKPLFSEETTKVLKNNPLLIELVETLVSLPPDRRREVLKAMKTLAEAVSLK